MLQVESDWRFKPDFNIKLTKSIDQYSQNQLNAMGKLLTNVCNLVIKDDELDWVDWDQFDDQWKQSFGNIKDVGIVFDLNDFTNPKVLIRWRDKNGDYHYENNDLKQVLKADAPLLKFLNNKWLPN